MLADELTVAQGIAMAFTLSLDPIPVAIAAEGARLALDAGLSAADLGTRISDATPLVKARCRLARALASALRARARARQRARPERGRQLRRNIAALAKARGMAVIALTADERSRTRSPTESSPSTRRRVD